MRPRKWEFWGRMAKIIDFSTFILVSIPNSAEFFGLKKWVLNFLLALFDCEVNICQGVVWDYTLYTPFNRESTSQNSIKIKYYFYRPIFIILSNYFCGHKYFFFSKKTNTSFIQLLPTVLILINQKSSKFVSLVFISFSRVN